MPDPLTYNEQSLQDAIEAVFQDWIKENDLTPSMVRVSLVIVEGQGYDADGNNVETCMMIPNGGTNSMLGLIAHADTAFRRSLSFQVE